MKRYFCNGKKGYCDRGNDNKIDCSACEFADGTGGEVVDCPDTNFEKIKAMSIDEMAEYFLTKSFDPCDITNFPVVDCDAGCDKCIRKWLESEVEEK